MKRYIVAVGLTVLLACTCCRGAISAEQVESLQPLIDQELEEVLKELIDTTEVSVELGLRWPVRPPNKPRDNIAITVRRQAEIQAFDDFPPQLEAGFRTEAEKLFKVYEIATKIAISLKDGMIVKGNLRSIDEKYIYIDAQKFRIADLDGRTRTLTDPELADRAKEKYILEKRIELRKQREERAAEAEEAIADKLYTDAGYLQVKGEWISRDQYLRNKVDERRQDLAKILAVPLQKKVYYENGFVLYDGDWMPRDEAIHLDERSRSVEGSSSGLLDDGDAEPKSPEDNSARSIWDIE
jgi:hypothetical protein